MDRIFSMDNKFFVFMGHVADLMILNILFIICSIPIVTIGASATAMYYVALKMVRNEESYIAKSFFRSFKQNFRQSTIVWVVMLLAGILLVADFLILAQMDASYVQFIRYGLLIITLIYGMIMVYIFPLLAKFYNTLKNTVKNSLLMSIRHLPMTLLMLVISFAPMIITLSFVQAFVYGSVIWILVGFALTAYLNSRFLVKIFDKYIPEEEDESAEGDSLEEFSDEEAQALENPEGIFPAPGAAIAADMPETAEGETSEESETGQDSSAEDPEEQ